MAATSEMVGTFVHYHVSMTRKVWASIDQISEQACLADDKYSRGSICNLMVHTVGWENNAA